MLYSRRKCCDIFYGDKINDLTLHNVIDVASALALKRVLCVHVMVKSNYSFYTQ
jgi:hypothetical protein